MITEVNPPKIIPPKFNTMPSAEFSSPAPPTIRIEPTTVMKTPMICRIVVFLLKEFLQQQ